VVVTNVTQFQTSRIRS